MHNCLIYISGPISADTKDKTEHNIKVGTRQGDRFWRKYHIPAFVPHAQTGFFADWNQDTDYWPVIAGDLLVISRCDAVFLLPGWESSHGAQIEVQYANKIGVRVFESEISLVEWVKSTYTYFGIQDLLPVYETEGVVHG